MYQLMKYSSAPQMKKPARKISAGVPPRMPTRPPTSTVTITTPAP